MEISLVRPDGEVYKVFPSLNAEMEHNCADCSGFCKDSCPGFSELEPLAKFLKEVRSYELIHLNIQHDKQSFARYKMPAQSVIISLLPLFMKKCMVSMPFLERAHSVELFVGNGEWWRFYSMKLVAYSALRQVSPATAIRESFSDKKKILTDLLETVFEFPGRDVVINAISTLCMICSLAESDPDFFLEQFVLTTPEGGLEPSVQR
ncbi:MAG: hypothetical protein V5783_09110 [Pontiella sp.]